MEPHKEMPSQLWMTWLLHNQSFGIETHPVLKLKRTLFHKNNPVCIHLNLNQTSLCTISVAKCTNQARYRGRSCKKMSARLARFKPFSFLPLTIIPIKKIRTSGVERKNGRFYRTFLFRFCQQLYCCQKISGKYELRNLPSKSLAFLSNDGHISHFTQLMKVEILVFRE